MPPRPSVGPSQAPFTSRCPPSNHTTMLIRLKKIPRISLGQNSIAFSNAPRREADSPPISPLAGPAVSQTETHGLGFLSLADAAPSNGENFRLRASCGRMVMHLTKVFPVAGSNPSRAIYGTAAADDSGPTRIRTAYLKFCSQVRYHWTGVWCEACEKTHHGDIWEFLNHVRNVLHLYTKRARPNVGYTLHPSFLLHCNRFASVSHFHFHDSNMPPHCLEPSERKLLTPPTPPSKK